MKSTSLLSAFRRNIVANTLVIIGLAFLATGLFAQPKGPKGTPAEMASRRLEHLTKMLSLTPEQAGKIKPILESSATEVAKIRDEKKGDRKAVMTAVKERFEATDKEISAVLTPEQQTKFAKSREKMREKMQERIEKRREGKK